MNHDAAHLNSATTELVALSSTERIRAIETDRWVQYPRARQALAILSYVLRHPRSTAHAFHSDIWRFWHGQDNDHGEVSS
jgi:uncharacterized protein YjiS (DUF1127 family)